MQCGYNGYSQYKIIQPDYLIFSIMAKKTSTKAPKTTKKSKGGSKKSGAAAAGGSKSA